MTNDNRQCKRKAYLGGKYCWQHERTVVKWSKNIYVVIFLSGLGLIADFLGIASFFQSTSPSTQITPTPIPSVPIGELLLDAGLTEIDSNEWFVTLRSPSSGAGWQAWGRWRLVDYDAYDGEGALSGTFNMYEPTQGPNAYWWSSDYDASNWFIEGYVTSPEDLSWQSFGWEPIPQIGSFVWKAHSGSINGKTHLHQVEFDIELPEDILIGAAQLIVFSDNHSVWYLNGKLVGVNVGSEPFIIDFDPRSFLNRGKNLLSVAVYNDNQPCNRDGTNENCNPIGIQYILRIKKVPFRLYSLEEFDKVLGHGNWTCLDGNPYIAIIKSIPAGFKVELPLIAVEKYGKIYRIGDEVPSGGQPTGIFLHPIPNNTCSTVRLEIKGSELDSILGNGNWSCMQRWDNAIKVLVTPPNLIVEKPFSLIDALGERFFPGETVPQGNEAVVWLQSEIEDRECAN